MPELTTTEQRALALMNQARIGGGGDVAFDLPHGFRRNPDDCALARGLKDVFPSVRFLTDHLEGSKQDIDRIAAIFGMSAAVGRKGLYRIDYCGPLSAWAEFVPGFDDYAFERLIDSREFTPSVGTVYSKRKDVFSSTQPPAYGDSLAAVLMPDGELVSV